MKWRYFVLCVLLYGSIAGQVYPPGDTEFYFNEFIELVINYHPLAQKADLNLDKASAANKMAKGGFDPKIEGGLDKKAYDQKNYYSLINSKLKVPTWYGIELNAKYNRNSGDFLNNSDLLPTRGLWSAGISVPLGKGFILDERRAALKQAQVFEQLSQQERIIAYNKLLLNAIMAYLDWQMNYEILRTFEEGEILARQNFESTRFAFLQGDKPAVDTLEAYVNWQTRINQKVEAERELLKSRQLLGIYLWSEEEAPLEIQESIRPEILDISFMVDQRDSFQLIVDEISQIHPEILAYNYKIKGVQIENELLREDLKPDLRIDFNPLVGTSGNDLFLPYETADYKLGARFQYTFLQRKTKGKLDLNKVKLKEAELDSNFKLEQIKNNLNLLIQNEEIYANQINTAAGIVSDTEKLLNAEIRKNQIGESSIFLLNSRELKFIESRLKQIKLMNKAFKNRFYLFYNTGQIGQLWKV